MLREHLATLQKLIDDSHVALTTVPESNDSAVLAIRPEGVEFGRGFRISFTETPVHVLASLGMEPYAGAILQQIAINQQRFRQAWITRWKKLEELGGQISCQVGNQAFRYPEFDVQPWSSLSLGATLPLAFASSNEAIFAFLQGFVDMVLTVVPVEEENRVEDDEVEAKWYEEGAKGQRVANHYERSRRNRQFCLDTYGYVCQVCGFDFEHEYGELGKEYAEVHHLEPVSAMAAPRELNPLEDLVVLCSNCHSMVHRKIPPITPNELRHLLGNRFPD